MKRGTRTRRFVLKSTLGAVFFATGNGIVTGKPNQDNTDVSVRGNQDNTDNSLFGDHSWDDGTELAASISTPDVAESITDVEFRGIDEQADVFETVLQGFPRPEETVEQNTYVVLSSGVAADAPGDPETFSSTDVNGRSFENFTPDNFDATNVAEIRLDISVPEGAEGIAFDYKFATEENPEYLGEEFQDFFEATLIRPNSSATNIAMLPDDSPVTVDNADSFANSPGGTSENPEPPFPDPPDVTYNSVTELQTASASLAGSEGETVRLILRIGDASDGIFDSAVFLDSLRFTGDVDESRTRVTSALREYETTVRWGIRRYADAIAEKDARLYAEYGDDYAEDVVGYFGYQSEELSEDALEEEVREAIERSGGKLEPEPARELYEFFDELFSDFDNTNYSEAELIDIFTDRYWNEYPLYGPDGEDVQPFAALDSAYQTRFEERRETFVEELETGDYTGGDISKIVSYLDARRVEHVEETWEALEYLFYETETLVAGDGIDGQIDAIEIPPANESGGGSTASVVGAVTVAAYFVAHTAVGKAALGAAKMALYKGGTWVSGHLSAHGVSLSVGQSAAVGSALKAASSTASVLTTIYHTNTFFVIHTAHAVKEAWKLGMSAGDFIGDVVADPQKQTPNRSANTPQDCIDIAERDVEIVDMSVEDVTDEDAIPSEHGLVGEQTGTITVENTGSSAFTPVPTGTIGVDMVITVAQGRTSGYPVRLTEPVPELAPGDTATIEFAYTVPVNLLPSRFTLDMSIIGHPGGARETFTAGLTEPSEISTETLDDGSITDGESATSRHTPADGTETLTYELDYSQLEADLHLYDQAGNHTGFDYSENVFVDDVPGATHSGPDEGVAGREVVTVTDPQSDEYTVDVVAPEIDTIVQSDTTAAGSAFSDETNNTSSGTSSASLDTSSASFGTGSASLDTSTLAGGTGPSPIEPVFNTATASDGVNIDYEVTARQVPNIPPTVRVSLAEAPPAVDRNEERIISMVAYEVGTHNDARDVSLSVSELEHENGSETIQSVSVVHTDLDVPAGSSTRFEIESTIPGSAPAGRYTGDVLLSSDNDDENAQTAGTVTVEIDTPLDDGLLFGYSAGELAAGGGAAAGLAYLYSQMGSGGSN